MTGTGRSGRESKDDKLSMFIEPHSDIGVVGRRSARRSGNGRRRSGSGRRTRIWRDDNKPAILIELRRTSRRTGRRTRRTLTGRGKDFTETRAMVSSRRGFRCFRCFRFFRGAVTTGTRRSGTGMRSGTRTRRGSGGREPGKGNFFFCSPNPMGASNFSYTKGL